MYLLTKKVTGLDKNSPDYNNPYIKCYHFDINIADNSILIVSP